MSGTPRTGDVKAFFLRYFIAILVLFGFVGYLLWDAGRHYNNVFLGQFGLALFSSCAIGVLFKWLSLDMFLNMELRNVLVDRAYISQLDTKQLLQSFESHFTEFQSRGDFPDSLTFHQLKTIVLDKMQGSWNNMRIRIVVEKKRHNNVPYLWLQETVSYEAVGRTGKPVFPDKAVIPDVELRIPEALRDQAPEEIYRFKYLKMDDKQVNVRARPEKAGQTLRCSVNTEEDLVFSGKPVDVEYSEEYAFPTVELLVEPFLCFTTSVEVECYHDESIEVDGYPFLTTLDYSEKSDEKLYTLRIKAVAWPGNGFCLLFRCAG
jgi:hypothetical protein